MKWIKYNAEAKRAIFNEETGVKEYIPIKLELEQEWSEDAEAALKERIIDIYEDGVAAAPAMDERVKELEQALLMLLEGATE